MRNQNNNKGGKNVVIYLTFDFSRVRTLPLEKMYENIEM